MTTTERQQRGTTGPSQRGLRKKEKKAKEPVVLRRSGRRTGGVAELAGGIDQERRDGSIVLADGRMITQGSGGLETREEEKKKGAGEAILSLTVTANEKTKTVKVELSSKFISKVREHERRRRMGREVYRVSSSNDERNQDDKNKDESDEFKIALEHENFGFERRRRRQVHGESRDARGFSPVHVGNHLSLWR